jgi:phage-related tail fiber protein
LSRSARAASVVARIAAASRPALVAPASPIASVPTGMPAGICTIDSRLSCPESALDCTGTPSTGRCVIAATMPGRCAAPPAPAMITLKPSSAACLAKATSRSGVRWAETMRMSVGTSSFSSTSAARLIVAQSDWLPMTIATGGGAEGVVTSPLREVIALGGIQGVV